jgi:hypothetical protein
VKKGEQLTGGRQFTAWSGREEGRGGRRMRNPVVVQNVSGRLNTAGTAGACRG